jgi:hypothetical protein
MIGPSSAMAKQDVNDIGHFKRSLGGVWPWLICHVTYLPRDPPLFAPYGRGK